MADGFVSSFKDVHSTLLKMISSLLVLLLVQGKWNLPQRSGLELWWIDQLDNTRRVTVYFTSVTGRTNAETGQLLFICCSSAKLWLLLLILSG